MASPSTVISLGFGTFGSVNLISTLGYGSGVGLSVVASPFCFHEGLSYSPGGTGGVVYVAGGSAGTDYSPGGSEGLRDCE